MMANYKELYDLEQEIDRLTDEIKEHQALTRHHSLIAKEHAEMSGELVGQRDALTKRWKQLERELSR